MVAIKNQTVAAIFRVFTPSEPKIHQEDSFFWLSWHEIQKFAYSIVLEHGSLPIPLWWLLESIKLFHSRINRILLYERFPWSWESLKSWLINWFSSEFLFKAYAIIKHRDGISISKLVSNGIFH